MQLASSERCLHLRTLRNALTDLRKKIFARRKMHMREMIHFLRAIKTVPSVFIHHTHEIKNKYWRKGDTYLEMKF